jgi:integrase
LTAATNRAKLTKRLLDGLTYQGDGKTRYIVWDTVIVGLGARIYPSGRKAFVLSYRVPGQRQKRLLTLGGFGSVLTIDQARSRARRELVMILDGDDPLIKRNREPKTLGDLIAAYQSQISTRKKSGEQDKRRFASSLPSSWRGRRFDSISRAEVSAHHKKIGQRAPYEANRVLALLSSVFNQAEDLLGTVPEPGWQNPTVGIKKFPEQKRDRWVRPTELARLARAIDQEPNIYVRSALWLCLLTGARKSEILTARWDQVDWDNKLLNLPETKTGRPQSIPLNAPALALIAAIPKLEGNPYLLPGQRTNQHLVNISKPWLGIRQRAGLPDLRIHDLRRTVGSWMSQSGVDLNRIKDALRHANISTTLTYAHLGQDHVREAMEAHGRRVQEVLETGRQGTASALRPESRSLPD